MMLGASEKKYAYFKLQKVFHCLPLAELRVIPWHCSDPSIFAWGTQC